MVAPSRPMHDAFHRALMCVMLQNDQSGDIFSKQLIDISNGKFPIDVLTSCIIFPESFCLLTQLKAELIQKLFPNVAQIIYSMIGLANELY
jgi:hypothetical protein